MELEQTEAKTSSGQHGSGHVTLFNYKKQKTHPSEAAPVLGWSDTFLVTITRHWIRQ